MITERALIVFVIAVKQAWRCRHTLAALFPASVFSVAYLSALSLVQCLLLLLVCHKEARRCRLTSEALFPASVLSAADGPAFSFVQCFPLWQREIL